MRSGLMRVATHCVAARDRFLVVTRERCERLASHCYSYNTSWERPTAASLASPSASSLLAISTCAGTQRTMISLSLLTRREQTSIAT